MTTRTTLLYKVFHTDKRAELSYFDSFEDAAKAAEAMIDSFKFWGGGAVPVSVSSSRWTKAGKYKDTPQSRDYSPALYMDYARENGDKCGYLQGKARRAAV